MGWLVIRGKGDSTREVRVEDTFTIGRALHCNLSLDLPGVSPHHAQIFTETQKNESRPVYRVRDLYSQQGTYLNDRPVTQDILKHEDVLTIGGCKLTFLLNSPDSETTSL